MTNGVVFDLKKIKSIGKRYNALQAAIKRMRLLEI